MLNDVLDIAEDMGIFNDIGKEKARKFALKLVKIARRYDCNAGEILYGMWERFGICSYCNKESDDIDEDGLFEECRE